MTRKEKTQQTRFDTKIAPLLKELNKLCKKFKMPMVTAVQLFENESDGAMVATQAVCVDEMSLPMTLSSSLMNGSTRVRVSENRIQLVVPHENLPAELEPYTNRPKAYPQKRRMTEAEPLSEHVKHCNDCRVMMEDAISRGERVDNIVVPPHDEANLVELMEEIRASKLPFIIPKNDIIH